MRRIQHDRVTLNGAQPVTGISSISKEQTAILSALTIKKPTLNTQLTLSEQAQQEIVKLFLATREEMENKRINEVFGQEFLNSNFWLYWRTMFAFEEWHSEVAWLFRTLPFDKLIEGRTQNADKDIHAGIPG